MKDYIRKVQYYETDKMGIVHHSNYIRWFEEARIFYMEELGFSYSQMEKAGIMIPVLGVNAIYKSGAAYGDTVKIITGIKSITPVKLSFSYEVRDINTNELKATGSTDHCFVNSGFKPCSIKKNVPEFYEMCQNIAKA